MAEEQWAPRPLTDEVAILDISAIPDVAIPDKAVPNLGAVQSTPVAWTRVVTEV